VKPFACVHATNWIYSCHKFNAYLPLLESILVWKRDCFGGSACWFGTLEDQVPDRNRLFYLTGDALRHSLNPLQSHRDSNRIWALSHRAVSAQFSLHTLPSHIWAVSFCGFVHFSPHRTPPPSISLTTVAQFWKPLQIFLQSLTYWAQSDLSYLELESFVGFRHHRLNWRSSSLEWRMG
jgi:hypothetical protein